jgi:hypothetical protein
MFQLAGVFPSRSRSSSHTSGHTREVASTSDMQSLKDYTNSLLFHGFSKSTWKTCSASQCWFLAFCYWSGLIHDNSSPLPASEQTLMLFTAHLSQTIKASSIKVYREFGLCILNRVSKNPQRTVFVWSVFYTESNGYKVPNSLSP